MKRLFPGSFEPSRNEIQENWDESLLILDSSVFISLYSRSSENVTRLINVLKQNDELLWIPYQAAKNYLDKREYIIDSKVQECEKFKTTFDESVRSIVSMMTKSNNPILQDLQGNLAEFAPVVSAFKNVIDKKLSEYSSQPSDVILEDLAEVMKNERIGSPSSYRVIENLQDEALRRETYQLPPFIHEDEVGLNKYYTILQWVQIITKIKKERKPALFITADYPKDWWQQVGENSYTSRAELINELNNELRVFFHIIDVNTFLSIAEDIHKERVENLEEHIVKFGKKSG